MVSSPILNRANSLFDRLLDSLFSPGAKPAATNDGVKSLAAQDTQDSASPKGPSSAQTAPNLLSALITGQQLYEMTDGSSVLFIAFAAAGGSYRVFHNFWVELFYRTPKLAFNGGSVVSYILFNPKDSTVTKARTLRFVYTYSKFKAKKMTDADNFTTATESKKKKVPNK